MFITACYEFLKAADTQTCVCAKKIWLCAVLTQNDKICKKKLIFAQNLMTVNQFLQYVWRIYDETD